MTMERSKKQSPLEMLVAYQQAQTSPTKATPKNRFQKGEKNTIVPIIPIVEDPVLNTALNTSLTDKNLVISNSSLVLNLNVNIDPDLIDRALEKSKQMAKTVAAAGAAMLGTAFIFSDKEKKPANIKVPLMPKIKIPKIRRDD